MAASKSLRAHSAAKSSSDVEPLKALLAAMRAVSAGDFSVLLPSHWDGIPGKLAETFNEIIGHNRRLADGLSRAGEQVGRKGRTRQRLPPANRQGSWSDMERSVNGLIDDLIRPVETITEAMAGVAKGDLTRSVPLEADGRPLQGEFLRAATLVNRMLEQMTEFSSEVTRVAREVGTEGKLGGQAKVKGVAGVWKDLTDSVNQMASNLTAQVRNISEVTIAVANGDLSRKITVDVRGEILQLKEAINTMVDQLRGFASEVTRVAREVGTEGKLGGQAIVPGVAGTWKDLTDSVNAMASNLTSQVRNIAEVTTAVAKGDLSRKITVDVRGEILALKDTINTMVDQLNGFAAEVTRVAREVGTEGKLGGQAEVPDVAGTWKDLTDHVNSMASNLTSQVRNIAEVTTAVAKGDLSRKITVDVRGEILELKNTINTMVDQLNGFAAEVTRVAREVGTEGKLGGQAVVPGIAGTWADLTDSVNAMASNLTAQVRNIAEVTTAVAKGDLSRKITVDVRGEILRAEEHHQHDGRSAQRLRGRSHARRARSRHRRQARRPGRSAGRRGYMEGSHRQRQLDGVEPDLAGAQHRRGDDGGGEGRPVAQDHGRRARRNPRAQEHDQHDGRPAQRLRRGSDARRARSRHRGQARRPGRSAGRRRHVEGPDRQRQLDGDEPDDAGAQHRRGRDLGRARRSFAQDRGRCAGRDPAAERHAEHDGRSAQRLRGRSDARRARSRHRGQARRPGARAGCRGYMEGSHRQRQLDGVEPDDAGARHRQGGDRGRDRRLAQEADRRSEGRDRRARRHDQRHDRDARDLRRPGDDGRARGRRRRPSRRPGQRAGHRRHLEGSHREREPARRQPDDAGARDRRGRDRGDAGRPDAFDPGRRARRGGRSQGQHQRDDRHAARDDGNESRAGLAEDQPRQILRHDAGPARPDHARQHAVVRARAAGQRATGPDVRRRDRRAHGSSAPAQARRLR